MLYGMSAGPAPEGDGDDDDDAGIGGKRSVKSGQRVRNVARMAVVFHIFKQMQPFYTVDEMKSFRTLGLEPSILSPFFRVSIDVSDVTQSDQASWLQG
jgi:hypothetical protein